MTTTTPPGPVELETLNLIDPSTYLDHDMGALWRQIRQTDPVFWHRPVDGRPGFWAITRHQDVAAIYRDRKRFSTERGNMLATLLYGGDPAGGRMVSVTDGSRHKDLRTMILKAFSPRALEYVAERIHLFTRRLLDEALEAGSCDFARDIAAKVPINTICDLLGVPGSDREYLLSLNKKAVSSDDADHSDAEARLARNEIVMYFSDLVEQRRGQDGDDVLSVLSNTKVSGEYLSSQDIVLNCYSLLLGGDETSRFSMIGAVHALATDKRQWAHLRSGDADLDLATEEIVRWSTPIMHIGRTVTEDVQVNGRTLKAGDIVTLWNSSANRDEEVFTEPDVLNLGRSPNGHLGFGFGAHFCVGVFLARTEISALLDALRTTVANIEPTGPPKAIYSNVLQGYSRLPVAFSRA